MSLNVNIPDTFAGPLDLLLHLIRRDEMDIHDIPVARLAATYLQEIEKMELVDVDEGAEFLDLASRLLEIKSRMLVPADELPDGEEEEDGGYDPRTDLVESLLEYRRFKDAARMLAEMANEQALRYPRLAPPPDFVSGGEGEDSAPEADSMALFAALQGLLLRMLPGEESNVITYTEVPTSVRVAQIETVLREIGTTRFSLLLSGNTTRREIVGFFIAMLEMIRQGRVTARQAENFSDIILERREPPAARTQGARPGRAARAGRGRLVARGRAGAGRIFPAAFGRGARVDKRRRRSQTRTRARVPAAFPAAAAGKVPPRPAEPAQEKTTSRRVVAFLPAPARRTGRKKYVR